VGLEVHRDLDFSIVRRVQKGSRVVMGKAECGLAGWFAAAILIKNLGW